MAFVREKKEGEQERGGETEREKRRPERYRKREMKSVKDREREKCR